MDAHKRSSLHFDRVAGSTPGSSSSSSAPTGAASNSNSNSANNVDTTECMDSISYLESAFHHGFMRSRLKTGDFVYLENAQLARELDDFCDVDAMHQPKGPIILLGESGVGKSTFLANWLVRRKKLFQSWHTAAYPEFIFYHVVGCSRQSCLVSNLLERMLREIKEYFELAKDIPDVAERLGWQFPRFLEAASKKGRVLLIIDGLQRLRTTDGESILKWVPLSFPPNVRIILSGTINYPVSISILPSSHSTIADHTGSEHHEKANLNAQMIERIKLEANRRRWVSVHVATLSEGDRKRIVQKFLYKHQPSHALSSSMSERTHIHDTTAPSVHQHQNDGLQLFEIQERAIVAVPMTANPYFLKLFLSCLVWATAEGFNIHYVVEHWLSAESAAQLLESILRAMETGYTPEAQATADAQQFLDENSIESECALPIQSLLSLRRKVSVDTVASNTGRSDVQPLHRPPSAQSAAPATAKSYGYHDARMSVGPAFAAAPTDKTISSSVIELQHGDGRSILTHDDRHDDSSPRVPPMIARTDSVHETKEVFVRTLGTGRSQQPIVTHDELSTGLQQQALASPVRLPCRSVVTPDGRNDVPSKLLRDLPQSQSVRVAPTPATFVRTRALPSYLTGGRVVAPLGELLSHALCLLYVCRHGLLANELRCILHAIVTEDRAIATHALPRKATFRYSKHRDAATPSGSESAVPNHAWLALLRALKALGVLTVQDVLVLPICNETFREVVWWRYIASERSEQQYHQWLIRFFRLHPTTFRRVEELPWHLQRCYEWDALRSVLVHLPMFELLYTANYKHELFGYWRVLTDGPLLVLDSSGRPSTSTSDATVRVIARPFDIVSEYSKSVDAWYRSARPPTKVFTPVVLLVTKFMYEFSLAYQGALPPFAHAPFDLKRLVTDGFCFAEDLPHIVQSTGASTVVSGAVPATMSGEAALSPNAGIAMAPSGTTAATTALLAALESFSTLGQSVGSSSSSSTGTSGGPLAVREKETSGNWFYFYQRWVWIHFPWLALSNDIVVREPFVSPNGIVTSSSSASLAASGGSAQQQQLVLAGSSSGVAGSSTGLDASRLSAIDAADGGDEELRREAGSSGATDIISVAPLYANSSSSSSTGLAGAKSIIHFDARFWDVKRSMFEVNSSSASQQLHALKPRGLASPPKVAARQHASVRSPAPTTKTQDVVSPAHVSRKKATYVAVKNVLTSSVRQLPTALAAATLPLPSVPEASSGSDGSRRQSILSSTSSAAAITAGLTFLTEISGNTVSSEMRITDVPTIEQVTPTGATARAHMNNGTRDLVLEHLGTGDITTPVRGAAAAVAFGLPAHTQDYPQSEWDLTRSYNLDVVLKLQTLYDAMKIETTRKHAHVAVLKRQLQDTARRYDLVLRECAMAKHAIAEMTARMAAIEHMTSAIERQERTHRKLLRACEQFPACDTVHLDAVQKERKLLTMQLQDVVEERKVLARKRLHLVSNVLPRLRDATDESKALMSAVVARLERARAKLAHDQAATDQLFARRLEMLASVQNASGSIGSSTDSVDSATDDNVERSSTPSTAQLSGRASASASTTRSLAATAALQQCESMYDKIQKATGFSKLEVILEKFQSRDELHASFEEQAKVYDARLKQIKVHQSELKAQRATLELSNATAASDDPRVLEERVRIAELELARTERTQTSLLTTSKEVIAGASRVVKLLGITSCRSPFARAIPAARLWPPPLGLDGDASVMSEFETLEPNDIASLLQICQDRASLMIDAIEGGRGDPDANYSVQLELDAPDKSRVSKERLASRAGGRARKPPGGGGNNNDKRDRSFDRGSVPMIVFPGSAGPSPSRNAGAFALSSMHTGLSPRATPDAIDEDESNEDPATRESVKASSRSKIVAKKRAIPGTNSVGHNSHTPPSGAS